MTSLVGDTFTEWTGDLDTRQSMISIFTHIRDIPYSLSRPAADPRTSMEQLLVSGKGSCVPKHYLLADMFRKLNLNVIFATIAFSWNDPDLRYSSGLRKLAARLPVAQHLACRVQVGNRWVLVDATWDPPLAPGGFLINDRWDGHSPMKWAVKPYIFPVLPGTSTARNHESCGANDPAAQGMTEGEKDHLDADEQARYYRESVAVQTSRQVMWKAQFYRKFEDWLVDLRNTGY